MTHRFNVNFSDSAYEDLQRLAALKNKTLADVIRDAIALSRWVHDQIDMGGRLLVEDRNGRLKEVIPR